MRTALNLADDLLHNVRSNSAATTFRGFFAVSRRSSVLAADGLDLPGVTWYPANWRPGVDGAGEYRPRGVGMELRGGPLDGRTGHVYDATEALWLVTVASDLRVGSGRQVPAPLPAGSRIVGRYILHPSSRTLQWFPVEGPELSLRFGRLWRDTKAPPNPLLRFWRRITSAI